MMDEDGEYLDELSDFSEASLSFGSGSEDFSLAPLPNIQKIESPKNQTNVELGVIIEDLEQVASRKGANGLLDLLGREKDKNKTELVIRVLEILTNGQTNVISINPRRALEVLVPFFVNSSSEIARLTCSLLGTLSFCDTNKASIVRNGGAQAVVSFLLNERVSSNSDLTSLCIETLCTLANNGENRQKIAVHGAVQAIIPLMSRYLNSEDIQSCGCRLLKFLAKEESNMHILLDKANQVDFALSEALAKFPLGSNDVCINAIEALNSFYQYDEKVEGDYSITQKIAQVTSDIARSPDSSSECRAGSLSILASMASSSSGSNSNVNDVIKCLEKSDAILASLRCLQDLSGDSQIISDGISIIHAVILDPDSCSTFFDRVGAEGAKDVINGVVLSMGIEIKNLSGNDIGIQTQGESIINILSTKLQNVLRSPNPDQAPDSDSDLEVVLTPDDEENIGIISPVTDLEGEDNGITKFGNHEIFTGDQEEGRKVQEEQESGSQDIDQYADESFEDEDEDEDEDGDGDVMENDTAAQFQNLNQINQDQDENEFHIDFQTSNRFDNSEEPESSDERYSGENDQEETKERIEEEEEVTFTSERQKSPRSANSGNNSFAFSTKSIAQTNSKPFNNGEANIAVFRVGSLTDRIDIPEKKINQLSNPVEKGLLLRKQLSEEKEKQQQVIKSLEKTSKLGENRTIAAMRQKRVTKLAARTVIKWVKYTQKKAFCENLESIKEAAKKQQAQLELDILRIEEERNDFRKQCNDLEIEQDQAVRRCDDLVSRNEELEQKVTSLKGELSIVQEGQIKASDLQSALNKERTERASLEGELASLRFDKVHSDDTFSELEIAISKAKHFESELQMAKHSLNQVKAESEAFKTRALEAETKLRAQAKEFAVAKKQLASSQKEQVAVRSALEESRQTVEDLSEQIQQWETRGETKQRSEIQNLRGQVHELEAQLQVERQDYEQEILRRSDIIKCQLETEYRMVMKAMTASRQRLEEKQNETERQRLQLSSQIDDLKAHIKKLNEQINIHHENLLGRYHDTQPTLLQDGNSQTKTEKEKEKEGATIASSSVDHETISKLESLFYSLSPEGEPLATLAYPGLVQFIRSAKLMPPRFTRANLDVIFASLAEKTKRKGRVDFEGFLYVLEELGQRSWSSRKVENCEAEKDDENERCTTLRWVLESEHVQNYVKVALGEESDAKATGKRLKTPSSVKSVSRKSLTSESPVQQRASRFLSKLWTKEKRPLRDIFTHYSKDERVSNAQQKSSLDNRTNMHVLHKGIDFTGIVQMAVDFDIVPSLFGRGEIRKLFNLVLSEANSASGTIFGTLGFSGWLDLLERIAVTKFPESKSVIKNDENGCYSVVDHQVCCMLQWMDASDGKSKIRNRQRSAVLVRKFACTSSPAPAKGQRKLIKK